MTHIPHHRLAHDIRAAMVNHAGLHREVAHSLAELSRLLGPGMDLSTTNSVVDSDKGDRNAACGYKAIRAIFEDDLDLCLPMLQVSSERLQTLLEGWCGHLPAAQSGQSVD